MARSSKLLTLVGFATLSIGSSLACEARPRGAHPANTVVATPAPSQGRRVTPKPGRPLTTPEGRPASGNVVSRGARRGD